MREIQVGGLRAQRHGVARVDDEDYPLVASRSWCLSSSPTSTVLYAVTGRRVAGKSRNIKMHHLITGAVGIDHIDGNGLNNQRANLRVATKSQNGANRGAVAGTSSQYKGVVWYKRDSCWQAAIRFENRNRHLGYFADELAAALAYDAAARSLFGEFARPNFPEGIS